mgnify:CR=1 FL=1
MNNGDFVVEKEFLDSAEIKSLSTTQFGVLMKLFGLLARNKRKMFWGYLLDDGGKPLSERKIRQHCGGGSRISFSTWDTTKKLLVESEILKIRSVRGNELLYCPGFARMNKRIESGEVVEVETVESDKQGADFFLGYDPDDARPNSELDTWQLLCRKWIALTGKGGLDLKTPFPADMALSSKEEVKSELINLAENMGVKNALHDMGIAFEFKDMQGGRISTMFYFISRWKSDDWHKRHSSEVVPEKKKNTAFKLVLEEAQFRVKRGDIQNYADLLEHFKHADDKELIKKVGKELKLHGANDRQSNTGHGKNSD